MIEEYFKKNFPAGTFERIRMVLQGKPHIGGSRGISEDETVEEKVALIFDGGKEEILAPEGTVYDYFVMERERYQGDPTLAQIKSIVESKREEPKWLRYELEDNHDGSRSFGPVLVPYETIKEMMKAL